MKYDFDRIIDRRNSDSVKWSDNQKLFGREDVISAWIADMDFAVPESVVSVIKDRSAHEIFGYPTPLPDYYESIISWLGRGHNKWLLNEDCFVNIPGVVPGIMLAILAFTQPGDKVIIQSPVYPPFFSVVTNNLRQLLINPLQYDNGKYHMDLSSLEKQIDDRTKMIVLCSPHNPVGRVWTKEELEQLGALCLRHNIIIVSDEIHRDLVLCGSHWSIASLDPALEQNSITLIAASKTFNIAGLFAAAAIIPNQKLRQQYLAAHARYCMENINIFGFIALTAAYRNGEEWLQQLLVYLKDNLDLLLKYFAENISAIKPVKTEGTFLSWLDCRSMQMSDQELKDWMYNKARVAMSEGIRFGAEGSGHLRLNFACPRTTLLEILQRIKNAC